jgi:hypothetical protein
MVGAAQLRSPPPNLPLGALFFIFAKFKRSENFAKMKKRARGFNAQKGAIFLFRNSASFYQIRILLTTLDSGERAKVPFFLGSPLWWLKKKNFNFF